ncbi:MAG: M67 family metallopeptidase [Acidimicrobiales bacterium]
MTSGVYAQIVAHCLERLPEEACGLLAGPASFHGLQPASSNYLPRENVNQPMAGEEPATQEEVPDTLDTVHYGYEACAFYPANNAASSARLYTVDPLDYLRADRDAEKRGLVILGVVHSHTHTDPYPSTVDIDQAPDPKWHYVIVGLGRPLPSTRAYSIRDRKASEGRLLIGDQG